MWDAFAGLTNFTKSFVEMMYFRRRNWIKTKNKKKFFAGNWSQFTPKSGEDQKKGLHRRLRPFSSENLWDLLVLDGYFSSGYPALYSQWEDT